MLIWNGLTNIVVFHSVVVLQILKHYVGQPSGIAQTGVEISNLIFLVVHILIPGMWANPLVSLRPV